MKNTVTLESLKERQKELTDELRAIERLIGVYEGKLNKEKQEYVNMVSETTLTTREKVVNIVTDLVFKNKRPVKAIEIFNAIKRTRILKDMRNEQATLAAILSQEVKKKSARLKKVTRGVYTIK
ncbi:MAG: hypothetical protein ABSF91_03060 [Bacteroidota bacterium]|jgi:hypothetical protein